MSGRRGVAPPSTSELGLTMRLSFNMLPEVHDDALNDELIDALRLGLEDVSRQRLRAILILFRRQANQENCLALKDLVSILNENKVKLRSRTTKLLQMKYNKKHGLDYEPMWKLMEEAQSRTGRDSVRATCGSRYQQTVTGSNLSSAFSDAQDQQLLGRLHKALQTSDGYDLNDLRDKLKNTDASQHGLIPRKRFRKICSENQLPITGALLTSLLSRCDDEKNGQIGWTEFMSLLETAENFESQTPVAKATGPRLAPSVSASQRAPPSPNPTTNTQQPPAGVKAGKVDSNKQESENSKENAKENSKEKAKENAKENARENAKENARENAKENARENARENAKETSSNNKKETAPLKKQKSVTFDPNASSQSKTADTSGGKVDTMGDEAMEEDYLKSEQRRIGEQLDQSTSSTAATSNGIREEASLDVLNKSNGSDKSGDLAKAVDESKAKSEASPRPVPVGSTPASAAAKKPSKQGSRVQSAKAKQPAGRPTSRANPRSGKKTKVADTTGKVPKKSSNAKGKEKIAIAEKIENPISVEAKEKQTTAHDDAKDETASVAMSRDSAMSILTTSAISTHSKDVDEQSSTGEQTKAPGEEARPPGDASQTPEQTPSDSSTLQKSSSSPSIASTHMSQVSQDSDSRDSSSQASDQPLLAAGQPSSADSRSVHSFVSSIGDEEKKKTVGASLMQSFKSFLKIGKKEEDVEEEEILTEEEEELLMLKGDVEADSKSEVGKETEPQKEPEKADETQEQEVEKENQPENKVDPQTTLEVIVQGREVTYYRPDAFAKTEFAPDPPSEELQLDWVYGYRGNDCRGNLFAVSGGTEILYFMSHYAIMLNTQLGRQRHYAKHTAEIRSMALHSDGITVATGQAKGPADSGVQANIHLWKIDSLETLMVLEDNFENAVTCLAFSSLQDYILAVDNSSKHMLSVWDFKSGNKIASTQLNTTVVCQASFHPNDSDKIISVGREHLVFWDLKTNEGGGKTIEQEKTGNYETNMKAKYVISMSFRGNGDLITGDSNGTIYVWPSGGNTISHTISHAHEGPVFTLQMLDKKLVSGGRDGCMQVWTLTAKGAENTGKFQIPKQEGGIRTILHYGSMVYMGTTVNSLLSLPLKETTFALTGDESTSCVTQGHYEEVHCMVSLPDGQFLTGSYDGTVSMCSTSDHKPLWRHMVKGTNIHCMDVHSGTKLIALGTKDAKMGQSVVVLSLGQSAEAPEMNRFKLGRGAASCLKISPDGGLIAVGCQDSSILVLQVHNGGSTLEMIGKFTGHSGPITGLDWSKDKMGEESGYLVQSNSNQLEYIIWSSQTYTAVENLEEVRNTEWSSHQCLMGFHVAGIWGKEEDGPLHISTDTILGERPLVVAGGVDGHVRLFRYPCGHSEAQCRQTSVHPFCFVCVRYASTPEPVLLTAGSKDYTICQWKIISSTST